MTASVGEYGQQHREMTHQAMKVRTQGGLVVAAKDVVYFCGCFDAEDDRVDEMRDGGNNNKESLNYSINRSHTRNKRATLWDTTCAHEGKPVDTASVSRYISNYPPGSAGLSAEVVSADASLECFRQRYPRRFKVRRLLQSGLGVRQCIDILLLRLQILLILLLLLLLLELVTYNRLRLDRIRFDSIERFGDTRRLQHTGYTLKL